MPFGRAAGAAARPPQLEGESKLISGSDDEAQAEARWQTLPEAHTRGGATTYAKRGKKPVGAKPAAAKGAQQPPPQPAAAAAAVKEKADEKAWNAQEAAVQSRMAVDDDETVWQTTPGDSSLASLMKVSLSPTFTQPCPPASAPSRSVVPCHPHAQASAG